MSDTYTTYTHNSFFSRIKQALVGFVLGPILFLASFFMLYWNEGRVDVSVIAKRSVDITNIAEVTPYHEALVSYTGTVSSEEMIGDAYLAEGSYLSLWRKVEMYAWTEKEHTDSQKNIGGSEDVTTTYTYVKEWTTSPESSARFAQSTGHENPPLDVPAGEKVVSQATIGTYALDMSRMVLPGGESIMVTADNVREADGFVRSGSYLFRGKGTAAAPEVGDLRISYSALPNPLPRATVFGQLSADGSAIQSHYGDDATLYRMTIGSREDGINDMHREHTIITWVLRAVGTVLMFLGLMMFLSPISTLLDVFPALGSVGRGFFGVLSFVLALTLSSVTILVSMFLHSLVAVLVACAIAAAIIIGLFVVRRRPQQQP